MVDFRLSDEQRMMQEMVHKFAATRMRPVADQYYREGEYIPEAELDKLIKEANQLRLLDYYYPEDIGGVGLTDRITSCLISEEMAWGDAGIGVHLMASGLAATAMKAMGSAEQWQKWATGFTNPDDEATIPQIAAFCMTEPEAGSNVMALTTTATRDGADWILRGTKTFITNGGRADVYVVIAQTNPGATNTMERATGLAAFIVEKGTEGLSSSPDFKKWGVLASNTTEVVLNNVRVPLENRLGGPDGREGGGMAGIYATLEATRVGVAASAIGIARAAYEAALQYAQERVQKKPIIQFQAIGHKLADMEVEINSARLLTWKAAWMDNESIGMDRGEGSQAKYKAGEVAVQVCLDAIQIHGGYGFMKEYPVGRWLNDALIYRIWEGTSEIQKNTIARYLSAVSGV